MQIVLLDEYTLNPGDLSSEELQALRTCIIHDRTAPHDVVARADTKIWQPVNNTGKKPCT